MPSRLRLGARGSRPTRGKAGNPESAPLNAVHIVGNLDPGGGQEVVRTLARFLPEAGCTPIVVTLRDGLLRADIERLGVAVELVPGRRHSIIAIPFAIAEMIRIRRDLARIIRRHHGSIVQTHLLRAVDFLVLTLRFEPSVHGVYWTVHNAQLDLPPDQVPHQRWLLRPKRIAHRLLYRIGARVVDGFVAVADDVGAEVRRQFRPPPHKIHVIPNGVDPARYAATGDRQALRRALKLPLTARVLIVVAKLHEQKGHAVLFECLEPLLAKAEDLHVLLVGDGPRRKALEARVAAMPTAERVHFLGARSDIPHLLRVSDLFVLPSLWEGLPMALLEAMAAGLPCVATYVSGSRDVVVDGETGLLVPPGDPGALGDAILRLLDNRLVARAMGAAGRRRVIDTFGGRSLAERHVAMYRAQLRIAGQ